MKTTNPHASRSEKKKMKESIVVFFFFFFFLDDWSLIGWDRRLLAVICSPQNSVFLNDVMGVKGFDGCERITGSNL